MEFDVILIFTLVYLGMALGNWPGLALDRTGIALLGAIAMIELKKLPLKEAINAVDISSITLLFSFMIISAQLYFSGFYTFITEKMNQWIISPKLFLLVIIIISGLLSAALINDIVCLAMTPLLIRTCRKKSFNPVPFLLGLAAASNIGSALTLIGNPQNILIGEVLKIPFAKYTLNALIPCVLGLLVTWGVISLQTTKWIENNKETEPLETPPFDSWQSLKGFITVTLVLMILLFLDLPKEHVALTAAGFLLLSRQMASKMMLSLIDWELLVLFIGLFIVNYHFNQTDVMPSLLKILEGYGINMYSPLSIFVTSALLSNLISNVPAVMLLLPFTTDHTNGTLLALSSTLAGNMFIVGSIANIIVITQASQFGITITGKQHMKCGLPIALITLLITFITLTF